MTDPRSDILRGTLDLMVLKTLGQMGPMHGYGLALRIEQLGEKAIRVNQGTIYLCLVRLVQKGWITASWAASDNNRRAKYYALSVAGEKQLKVEEENWDRIVGVMAQVMRPLPEN